MWRKSFIKIKTHAKISQGLQFCRAPFQEFNIYNTIFTKPSEIRIIALHQQGLIIYKDCTDKDLIDNKIGLMGLLTSKMDYMSNWD